ncbi:dihydroxyacetone kinase subunit DhaL [Geomicrobium sp. JSM 1781026]|uniref:dihydroxyacetone kinase subunit DhaL n=1 Tax=Geomicrobium sp. JSM 1781026 TaxID=3344580 RepID=UPI0035BEE592
MTTEQLHEWMKETYELIQNNKEELSALDQAVGDGDHGTNMNRGFQTVVEELPNWEGETFATTLQKIGMTLISKVGGASGPLLGTGFMRLSASFKDEVNWGNGLESASEGIAKRGKAEVGEATLLDVWSAVGESVREHGLDWDRVADVSRDAMERTKALEAKRGRGALLGERSVGHLDPGAVSSYYLFQALARVMKGADD